MNHGHGFGTCGRCGRLAPVDALKRTLRHPAAEDSTARCLGEGHKAIEQQRAHYRMGVAL